MTATLLLMLLLLGKHFVADFPLQFPRHYKNKGFYGRWGGIEHALIHAGVTWCVLIHFVGVFLAVLVAVAEGVAHYHIDWAKMNVNAHFYLKPDNSEKFWWLLGFDQFLHQACYVLIVWYVL